MRKKRHKLVNVVLSFNIKSVHATTIFTANFNLMIFAEKLNLRENFLWDLSNLMHSCKKVISSATCIFLTFQATETRRFSTYFSRQHGWYYMLLTLQKYGVQMEHPAEHCDRGELSAGEQPVWKRQRCRSLSSLYLTWIFVISFNFCFLLFKIQNVTEVQIFHLKCVALAEGPHSLNQMTWQSPKQFNLWGSLRKI